MFADLGLSFFRYLVRTMVIFVGNVKLCVIKLALTDLFLKSHDLYFLVLAVFKLNVGFIDVQVI